MQRSAHNQRISAQRKPLRVLLVSSRFFPYVGGVETHVYEVGKRLVQAGVQVTVLTTDVSGRLPTFEELEGIHIFRVPAWPSTRDYYFAPAMYRFITGGSWDVVHCQGYHNLVPPLAMLAASWAHIPFVLSFHSGGDLSQLRKMLRKLQWTMLRPFLSRAQKLIAVSQFEAEFFRGQLRLPAEQFMVIPNGAAHLPQVIASSEVRGQERNRGHLIVSIGRLVRYKGHHRVISALPKVLEHVPDAHMRIVGMGPYESTLQKMAKQLGVADRVEILAIPPGDGDGMASLIAQASLVTLLSEHEAQGLAVMEALAFSRPVLVTSTSALQELVDRGLACAVSLESTPEEVAMAIVNQLRHPLVPRNVALPTWDACSETLLSLYWTIGRGELCVS